MRFIKNNFDYAKYINYLIMLYAFSIPISRAGISIFSVLLVILWFLEGNFKEKYKKLKNNKFIIFLSIYIIYRFISLIWTDYEYFSHGADQAFKIVRLVFFPILVIATSLKKEYISKTIFAFLMGMLISEIISYGIFFEIWHFHNRPPYDPTPFMHHLDYATFLTFTSLLLLNRFFNTVNWRLKVFYFIYFLFVTSNLFLNGGRTGHLAFAVSIFAVGFTNIKNKLKAFFSMLLLVISIFYAAYNISPVFKQRFNEGASEVYKIKNNSSNQYQGSFGQRLGAWIIGLKIIQDNPLFGTGGGCEMAKLKEYAQKSSPQLQVVQNIAHFHNEYVHNAVEYGLLGLFLYLLFWYHLFKLEIKDKSFNNLKIILISVFSSASLVELIFHNQFPMSLFALFVGIFLNLSLKNKQIL